MVARGLIQPHPSGPGQTPSPTFLVQVGILTRNNSSAGSTWSRSHASSSAPGTSKSQRGRPSGQSAREGRGRSQTPAHGTCQHDSQQTGALDTVTVALLHSHYPGNSGCSPTLSGGCRAQRTSPTVQLRPMVLQGSAGLAHSAAQTHGAAGSPSTWSDSSTAQHGHRHRSGPTFAICRETLRMPTGLWVCARIQGFLFRGDHTHCISWQVFVDKGKKIPLLINSPSEANRKVCW